jgi:hypothetical protein
MTRPTRKSAPITATISTFLELPGAVFYGDVLDEDVDQAARLQAIRADFESDDNQASLWHELGQMGFDYDEIKAAVLNPASITSCNYGRPNPALIAA